MTLLKENILPEAAGLVQRKPRLHHKARQLQKALEAIVCRLRKKLTARQVHRLRTTIRRIESLAVYGQPRLSGKRKETLADLNTLRKRAGKTRNLDVQMGLLGSIANGSAGQDRRELLQALSDKRQRRADRLQDAIAKAGKAKFLARTGRLLEVTAAPGQRVRTRPDPLQSATERLERLAAGCVDRRSLKPGKLHELRTQLKEIRYVAELAGESPAQAQFIQEIKSVQNAIGEWHDWASLARAADKQFGDRINCPLLVEIQTLLAARYSAATESVRNLFAEFRQAAAVPMEAESAESILRPRQPRPARASHMLARSA